MEEKCKRKKGEKTDKSYVKIEMHAGEHVEKNTRALACSVSLGGAQRKTNNVTKAACARARAYARGEMCVRIKSRIHVLEINSYFFNDMYISGDRSTDRENLPPRLFYTVLKRVRARLLYIHRGKMHRD